MKSGIAVFSIVTLVGIGLGIYKTRATLISISEVQDLFSGLVYYLEDHAGEMPASEEAFRAAAFVETTPEGALRVGDRPDDPFQRRAVGAEIAWIADYRIAWGADLASLEIDRGGMLRDPDGKEVLLLGAGGNLDTLRQFSRDLLKVSREIREAAASPASQPVPSP